jgi:hypothetical protein
MSARIFLFRASSDVPLNSRISFDVLSAGSRSRRAEISCSDIPSSKQCRLAAFFRSSFNGNFSRACIPKIPARALLLAPGLMVVAVRPERTAPTPHDRLARLGSSLRPIPRSGSGTSRWGCSNWPSRSCNDDAEFLRSSSREVRGGRLHVPGRFRYSMDVPLLAMVPQFRRPS